LGSSTATHCRGLDPEEPVTTSSCLCSFHDLEVRGCFLDELLAAPDTPDLGCLATYESRALRDCRQLLEPPAGVGGKAGALEEVAAHVEAHSHPRLWRLLAEHALEALDWGLADRAFVRCADYQVRSGVCVCAEDYPRDT
jgi:WD repeat-containing protein 35